MINGNTKLSDLISESENQNELQHKANEHGAIDKDFYNKLPEWYSYTLDRLDKAFYGRPWFEEAWKKYRDHVMNSETKNIRAPGYIFNSYLKKDHELNPSDLMFGLEGDYYVYPELRSAAERKADSKEVYYSEEDINSLKHFDEKEHPRGKNGQFISKGWTKEDEERKELLTKQNTLMIAEQKNKELKDAKKKEAAEDTKKVLEAEIKSVNDIGNGVKTVANSVDKLIPEKSGKTIRGSYPELSDQELKKRINRIQDEQRYSDLVGDTKYVKSGEEKTREALQTITASVGLATAIVSLALMVKGVGGSSKPKKNIVKGIKK